ncbi:MAG: hypothetical protein ACR2OO_11405, partial [Thermomicrobiales bacterium]
MNKTKMFAFVRLVGVLTMVLSTLSYAQGSYAAPGGTAKTQLSRFDTTTTTSNGQIGGDATTGGATGGNGGSGADGSSGGTGT